MNEILYIDTEEEDMSKNLSDTSMATSENVINLTALIVPSPANDSNSNISRGPLLSDESLTGLMVLYTLTTLLSITGNIFVVLVFTKGRHSRTDLRPFLINLAVADLVMAFFCMPFTFADTILGHWVFYKPLCTLVLFVQLFAVAASVMTNMAIGIDRFLVVLFPLRSRVTYSRSKYVIGVIWFSAFSLASVQFFVGRAQKNGDIYKCIEVWPTPESRKIYTVCLFLCTYIIPLFILSITYSIVGILLWKRTAPGNKDQTRDLHRLRSKIKIVKMLVIVVAVFGVCWLPLHVFAMLVDFYDGFLHFESDQEHMMVLIMFLCVHWLAMSNSFANPIIYGFTNENFRKDLAVLFYMWFPCCGCLVKMLPRTTSSQSRTKDSFIMRQQSTMKRGYRLGNESVYYRHNDRIPRYSSIKTSVRDSKESGSE
ncbi:neuropeptide Y receptor type 5-like [Saccostrea echinata]|uniref:neuropeptide Y receptor type 5-like n=1 Tax=Saccostrea echinata TaxID=191078 RepID=UPI002A7F9058|nr:neuropeptide Y receptor type 5-like [Saccostrea echinata]